MKNDDLSECIRLFREWVHSFHANSFQKLQEILETIPKEDILVFVDYVRRHGYEPHLVFSAFDEEIWIPYEWEKEETKEHFKRLEALSFVRKKLSFLKDITSQRPITFGENPKPKPAMSCNPISTPFTAFTTKGKKKMTALEQGA